MTNENLNIAVQQDNKPTNKVAVAGTAAGAIGAVLMAIQTLVGPAIEETLAGMLGPNALSLVTAGVGALIGYFALKYGSQTAAFNVLDRPNVPMVPVRSMPTLGNIVVREKTDSPIEEDQP